MTRRHSGKRTHRRKHFAPPKVPNEDQLQTYHSYGVITKYHGGHDRSMDVTIYNTDTARFEEVKCRLKGSLRHSKCRQQISVGSYCLVSYGEEVAIIFTTGQTMSIPEHIYNNLTKVNKFNYAGDTSVTDDGVRFARDDDYMPTIDSESESDSESDGIVFESSDDTELVDEAHGINIDAI